VETNTIKICHKTVSRKERKKERKTDRQRERNWCIEVHYSHMHANTCSGIQFL